MPMTIRMKLRLAVRWILGLLLVWAAIPKLGNLQDFYASLLAYQLPFPDGLLRLTAVTLPWLELLCGLMLLTSVAIPIALLWSVVLFAVFTLATGQAWMRGLEISCGCLDFGWLGLQELQPAIESVRFAFFRALLLAAGALYLWRSQRRVDLPMPG